MSENVERLMTVAEAMAILDAEPVPLRVRRSALAASRGAMLAAEIRADRDYPPFDKSVMDGYAVNAADLAALPSELAVVEEVAAGNMSWQGIGSGEAVAIMTGAPIPHNADTVIPIEWTNGAGVGQRVKIFRLGQRGQMIVRRGSDCTAGTVVLPIGTTMGPAQIAVAASVGAAQVEVFVKPRVAVMSSGNEIVPITAAPAWSQIRNSNAAMLTALIEGHGWSSECWELALPRDEPWAIESAFRDGKEFDAVFVSGGMSMGKYDFVPGVLRDLGVEMKISKLRIKPGKPFAFGVWNHDGGKTFIFGLPGNPVSAYVCTLRLASRVLRRMGGAPAALPRRKATLAEAVTANGAREFYLPASWKNGAAAPLAWKGSGDVLSLAAAEALIVRPENDPAREPGHEVEIIEL